MVNFYELAEKALELERSGKKLIRLNVGDSNLPTPKCAVDAATISMKKTKSGYVSAAGIMEFREKIANREGCEVGNVVVGSGSKPLLYGLVSILCKTGDAVAFPDPYWPAYELICKQLGLRYENIKTNMENRWNFNSVNLEQIKLLMICNPLNPTSTVYPEELIKKTIEEAARKDIPVILDEAYKDLAFKKIPRYTGDNVIRVRSFSKEFNMEGWRLGYAIASKEIVKKMISFNQITTTCTPEFIQRAGIACLDNELEIVESNRAIWKERAKVASAELKKAGFEFAEPESGIYIFATHKKITDSGKYAVELLEKEGAVVAPGTGFGDHKKFVRICLNQEPETLRQAISRM
ncbi:pyridoxal phosphate-dependent aminotransferase [Candidatus Micrarchaeota archaeon]|nr:pyridoxal phosphate-dependent aminotransferase [Candidatus Micrarchaeota archaeon]